MAGVGAAFRAGVAVRRGVCPLAAARHERPVLVPVDLVAARFGGAAALCRYPAARQNALLVFAACMVRCMCGFEFISTFLILCEAPLVYCWAGGDRRAWLRRMICTGFAAVGGVAAALGAWFIQGVIYFGSAAGSWQNLTGAVTSRVSLTDDMVSNVSVAQVLTRYFVEVDEPLLQFGPLTITLKPLIAVTLLGFALCLAVLALRKKPLAVLAGPALVWVLNLAAPVSWMVLSKAHAYVHVHLVPMLWHFALVPVSCALLVWLVKTVITAVKE